MTPEEQIKGFIDKFDPAVARQIKALRKALRKRLPGAVELVYDNYNFFVIGYGPNERASEAVLSMAADAHGVSICFTHGVKLPDPAKLLTGGGNQVRFLKHVSASDVTKPEVDELIEAALVLAKTPMPAGKGSTVVKAISAKQRPRRIEPK